MFPKALAVDIQKKLKGKKPDVTAAFVLTTIYTWQNTRGNKFERFGKKAAFKSCEGLQADLPWLDSKTILRAINRLEKAFGTMFTVYRDSTREMNYSISPTLIKRYLSAKEGMLSLWADDAEKYGVIEAILIRNLEYKTDPRHVTNPLTDANGRIYGAMSATILTQKREEDQLPILPFSRKQVQGGISKLKARGVFLEHAGKHGFYALIRQSDPAQTVILKVSSNAPVLSPNAPVVSPNAPVSQDKIEIDRKSKIESVMNGTSTSLRLSELPMVFPSNDSDRNETISSKELECSFHEALAEAGKPRSLSEAYPGIALEIQKRMDYYRQIASTNSCVQIVATDELPYDVIVNPIMALWQDEELLLNPLTNKPVNLADFEEQIDMALYHLEEPLHDAFGTLPKCDLLLFRQIFRDHHDLTVPIQAANGICIGENDRRQWNAEYFAHLIKNLAQFIRYFEQMFVETFIPFETDLDYNDGIVMIDGGPVRDWTWINDEYADLFQDCDGFPVPDVVWSICRRTIARQNDRIVLFQNSPEMLMIA